MADLMVDLIQSSEKNAIMLGLLIEHWPIVVMYIYSPEQVMEMIICL
jgi:hypothetical protein